MIQKSWAAKSASKLHQWTNAFRLWLVSFLPAPPPPAGLHVFLIREDSLPQQTSSSVIHKRVLPFDPETHQPSVLHFHPFFPLLARPPGIVQAQVVRPVNLSLQSGLLTVFTVDQAIHVIKPSGSLSLYCSTALTASGIGGSFTASNEPAGVPLDL